MAKNIQTEELGRPVGMWVWCLHCERCYQVGEFRVEKPDRQIINTDFIVKTEMCPFPDCDGDTLTDSWTWESIREIHPEYPEVPERGKVYPMY
jgi:hypothetical protein